MFTVKEYNNFSIASILNISVHIKKNQRLRLKANISNLFGQNKIEEHHKT